MNRLRHVILALAIFLAATTALHSQSTYATITGIVTDSTGAVLAKVDVEAVEASSGYRYTAQSNDAGSFTLPQLLQGKYRVRMSSPGLTDWVVEGVLLQPRHVRRLDATLSVTTVQIKVGVTG